jgi:D-alanyl-D-alanine carboxypeptidase
MPKKITSLEVATHLDSYFRKLQARRPSHPIQIRVFSQRLGLDYTYPAASADQRYHIASIGKMFTAVLIQMLAERGVFSLQDPIQRFFTVSELDGLFVYQSQDHASRVTIEHLLRHTSGVADYFEGIAKIIEGGKRRRKDFIDEVISNPDHFWTPQELIEYTRTYQSAVGMPGQKFNYSDTGYILLGLLIEKVTGKSFAQNLSDHIFAPLGMCNSYLMFHSEPANMPVKEIEQIWLNNVEISRFKSLSCDWAGGGIISTTADLLLFDQALRSGRLIRDETLQRMDQCNHRFRQGIHYGLGMMEIHFKEFFFLLGHLPRVKGHIGILSTHLFYDPSNDAHIIMNFGDNKSMVDSFKTLIEIENTLQRVGQ